MDSSIRGSLRPCSSVARVVWHNITQGWQGTMGSSGWHFSRSRWHRCAALMEQGPISFDCRVVSQIAPYSLFSAVQYVGNRVPLGMQPGVTDSLHQGKCKKEQGDSPGPSKIRGGNSNNRIGKSSNHIEREVFGSRSMERSLEDGAVSAVSVHWSADVPVATGLKDRETHWRTKEFNKADLSLVQCQLKQGFIKGSKFIKMLRCWQVNNLVTN
jgi:hypothetical protein